jgi:hypothetical protein
MLLASDRSICLGALHLLTHDLREKRMECAKALLPLLHIAQWDFWHHLVMSNELYFS